MKISIFLIAIGLMSILIPTSNVYGTLFGDNGPKIGGDVGKVWEKGKDEVNKGLESAKETIMEPCNLATAGCGSPNPNPSQILEEQLDFDFDVPYIIPGTNIGGEVSFVGNALHLPDIDIQPRVAGFSADDFGNIDLGSDFMFSQEFIADDIVDIVKDLIPSMKFSDNIDIEDVVSALNKYFDTNIPDDIVQAKMKLTLTMKMPIPQINMNDLNSINKLRELWHNPEISVIFQECHSKSTEDISEGECPWRTIQEFKT